MFCLSKKGLVPRPLVTFYFSLGVEEDGCPLAEAFDATIKEFAKPLVRWQDASTTDVEALDAAIDELEAGGGTEDLEVFGAEAFDAAGWATEGIGTKGFGLLEGFFFIACLGAPAL